ncbi:unnamed protein product [Rhizoctonia solani]|uniref:F-box-like domain protein n=1 Tax=Rhizoctonia solani TaxID=456999 RepID=A0A8H3AVQ9_9AGAM|nr:unnamed protein product [Rhizoctonia solani]
MAEQLRTAGDQLRIAWDNYFRVYSHLENDYTQIEASGGGNLPLEITQQLNTELAFISSYEQKIREVKAIISGARNYSSGLAPINTLPPEILSRIFHLALPSDCGLHILCYNKAYYDRYPDYFAQVCTLWRRVAVSTRALWCHIDLLPHRPYSKGLVSRAKTHVERAGKLPIQLHISSDDDYSFEYDDLHQFLSHISRRVETLELRMDGPFRGFHRGLFKVLLHERPALTKLVLNSQGPYFNNFLVPDSYDAEELEEDCWSLFLDSTENEIENSFASLTMLHSRGMFPLWTSTAYHRLVDLRLLSTSKWSHIREAELVAVLSSSPGLRILHFGLEIHDPVSTGEGVVPVFLKDLQVVRIFVEDCDEIHLSPDSILRLLAPGSKPLRLCISGYYAPKADSITEIEKFFARSRVSRFYAQYNFPPLSLLLRQAAHIERVVLKDIEYYTRVDFPATWLQVNTYTSSPRLRSLDIFDSLLSQSELRLLVECCPNGTTLYSSRVDHQSGPGEDNKCTPFTPHELAGSFNTVIVKGSYGVPSRNPTAGWDILDSD